MKDALSKTKPSVEKTKPSAARLQRVRDLRLVVCLLLTAAVGLCVLLAVNLTGVFTGVSLPLSPLSLGVAGTAGLPGVTLLLLLNLLLRP